MTPYITAGLAVRSQIRHYLLREGVKFVEDKRWFSSEFYLDCSDEKLKEIYKTLEEHKRKLSKEDSIN